MKNNKSIRTRFAPSPTGALHIGGCKMALLNYLFSKQNGGECILRLEDTDQTRLDPNSEKHIIDSFKWLGIDFDESPWKGGKHAPYVQSQREYEGYAQELVGYGKAYYAFDTSDDLKTARDNWDKLDPRPCYNHLTRLSMNNSLSISKEELKKKFDNNEPYVIRWKWEKGSTTVNDVAKGDVTFDHDTLDDKVLFKSDGLPTYHLANVVDDSLMEISHVIRGDEWLNSTPLHINLYKALDLELPTFVHCPLLLTPDGAKISKRNAHKYGLSVFVTSYDGTEGYKEMGYEPHSLLNFLLLLGYSVNKDGDSDSDSDSISLEDMISTFDLTRIGKSGAKVFKDKLDYLNSQLINDIPSTELLMKGCRGLFKDNYTKLNIPKVKIVADACKDRSTLLKDVYSHAKHFFIEPTYKDDFKKKVTQEGLDTLKEWISNANFDSVDTIKQGIYDACVANNLKMGKVMPSLRYCLTGGHDSPDLISIMYVRGKDSVKELINLI